MKIKKMLLLNILDDKIKEFINNTCERYDLKKPSLLPHITLRGPFLYNKRKPSKNIIIKLNTFIEDIKNNKQELKIKGIGMFCDNDIYVIYLNVIPTNILKSLSYKKDYSFAKYGFNPHITIFSTKDKKKALQIKSTLEFKNLEFSCKKVEWGIHELKSIEKNMFNISNFS
ncbi:hypothetical protein Arnit_2431 [Arcobacter nitrofigilis DSM 7299]|uniref:Phosphoesterase HXTX n=1 Tax=Arcobacter nitrofigilis (strain ATCC 33309 / DSM 7299 / CCUG 15893 / LMG 7604 / NCTC 12251 / CI) TaxID=572480 RepID=D5V1B9_ARCNC|nr:2'-5' RNA ligase family protein [Arcobacter nitrofigilis]ADG94081.1 hypothetical protein Arnit_2431 [Arcobacter nitrofigilis DSM 7299]